MSHSPGPHSSHPWPTIMSAALCQCTVGAVAVVCLGQPAQIFRSSVTAAAIDVIVTDDHGNPVEGLTKDDFEVTDDGVRREIISVSFVSIPIARPQALPSRPSDVVTNSPDLLGRRIFVIVVDDIGTAPKDTLRTRAAAKSIVQSLPDGDLVALAFTGQQAGAQEFTSDKARVLENLNRFVGRRPVFDDIDNVPLSEQDKQSVDPAIGSERIQNLGRALNTLKNVAVWLSPIEGRRKTVLYVTAGLPSHLANAFTDPRTANSDFRALITLATQANVAIYPVDARGLAAPDDHDSAAAGLWALANDTGGIATINTNDIARAVTVAVRDSSAYYLVGYSLPEAKTGRKADPRRVTVRVLRPGLTVRARLLSAGGPASPRDRVSMATVMASPLAGGRILAALHAASFAATSGSARTLFTLEVGGDAIRFSEREGRLSASLQYRIVASDVAGRIVASDSKTLEFHVSAARRDQMRDSRTRLVSSLDLPPGTYRVRAAILDPGSGEHGLLTGDLDVPRYDRGLSMSSVTIASLAGAHIPTMRDNLSLFESRLSGPPTSQRTFGQSDTLDAFTEVYSTAPADQVHATMSLLREHGSRVSEGPIRPIREKGIGGVQCLRLRTRLPLAGLEPASYRLTLEAKTDAMSIERSVSFVVR